MGFSKRKITVAGIEVELDTADGLPIADISADMDQVASQMAWWASVWAAAERERMEADAFYRRWRGIETLRHAETKPPPAEWKVRAMVEADPKFVEYKAAMARAEENVTLAKGVWESYAKKANMLQSRGARERQELEATGMTTKSSSRDTNSLPAGAGGDPVADARKSRMKELNKAKKAKENS